jgi:hypothetical protein
MIGTCFKRIKINNNKQNLVQGNAGPPSSPSPSPSSSSLLGHRPAL